MIDTSSVNFAIDKLSQGWQKIAPTIQDVGEKYVRYVVTKQVISGSLVLISILLGAFFCINFATRISKWAKEDAIGPALVNGIGAFVFVTIGLFGIVELRDAVLAMTNPEMFTIHELIKAAK